jgi:hypothetical protein
MRLPFLFTRRNVQPTTGLFVPEASVIQTQIYSTINNAYELRGRLLDSTGQIVYLRHPIQTLGSNGFAFISTFQLPEGFLQAAYLLDTSVLGNLRYGDAFGRIHLGVGNPSTNFAAQLLAADWITARYGPSFPAGRIIHPIETPGRIKQVIGSTPPAGSNFNEVTPLNVKRQLSSLTFVLQTSAAAGNRTINIGFQGDGTNYDNVFTFPTLQAPSTTIRYNLFTGANVTNAGTTTTMPLAGHLWEHLFAFNSLAGGLDVADQFSGVAYIVQDHFETDA